MAYASKIDFDKYKQTFPTQLRKIMEERKCTQKELGKAIGVTYQAVGAYMRGETMPILNVAQAIADYFNISLDYLSGRSNVSSRNEGLQQLHEKTSLSEQAIESLCLLSPNERRLINDLLSSKTDLQSIALSYTRIKDLKKSSENIPALDTNNEFERKIKNDIDYIRYTLSNDFIFFAEKNI